LSGGGSAPCHHRPPSQLSARLRAATRICWSLRRRCARWTWMTGELRILRTSARHWLVLGTPTTSCFRAGQTAGLRTTGRRSWRSSGPRAGSAGFSSGIIAATGQSLQRSLSACLTAVHNEVVAMRTGVCILAMDVDSEVLDFRRPTMRRARRRAALLHSPVRGPSGRRVPFRLDLRGRLIGTRQPAPLSSPSTRCQTGPAGVLGWLSGSPQRRRGRRGACVMSVGRRRHTPLAVRWTRGRDMSLACQPKACDFGGTDPVFDTGRYVHAVG
jgi:hypothetical protein